MSLFHYCHEHVLSLCSQVDGVLCLADILTDDSHSEATRAEAAAVVAQVTSPHLPFTQHLSSFLESMEEIVTALVSESSGVRGCRWVRGALSRLSSEKAPWAPSLHPTQLLHRDHMCQIPAVKDQSQTWKSFVVKSSIRMLAAL